MTTISLIKYLKPEDETNPYENNKIVLQFNGSNINYVIMNTLRRTILEMVPIYAFHTDNIIITKNTSIFNNDYMRLRISNLPIYSIKHPDLNNEKTIENLEKIEYLSVLKTFERNVLDNDTSYNDEHQNLNKIIMSINVINDTNEILNVMTDNPKVKFYINDVQVEHIYKVPLLLIQLKPEQQFICTATSNLNIAINNAIYRSCSKCYYEELVETNETDIDNTKECNNFSFILSSRRQISELNLIIRACQIIKKMIKYKIDVIINKFDESSNEGEIIIENSQYTFGNLISYYMQSHNDIIFAGYVVENPNINEVKIIYRSKNNIVNILKDVQNNVITFFDDIENKISKL